ncbi:MAG: T9SS type A sorting domain-containing protein [Ignavibacteriae bacterium]|nr:T9SS type A sorting domain-containing protein [Ignavibacteriota bacterium]
MISSFRTYILCLLIPMVRVAAFATEYTVSSAAQIAQVMQTARPGDTLTMSNGTWTNQDILFQGNGAAGNPITLRARTYGAVTLNGTSRLRIVGNYLVAENFLFQNGNCGSNPVVEFRNGSLESNYCRFTNSAIINYSPPDINTDSKWVSLYGTYNRVDRCFFRNKTNSGTTLVVWLTNHPNYHQIDHNHFGLRPALGFNGGETIRVGTSDWSMYDSFSTVELNLFEECNGEIEIISSKSCGNVYRYNTFVSCQGALTLRHGNRCTVEGNFFFGNGAPNSGGIRIIGEDHTVFNNYIAGTTGNSMKSALSFVNGVPNSPLNRYFQVKRAIVAFNTLVDNATNLTIGAGADSELTLPPLDCTIANNIVYGTTSPLITQVAAPINMTWQGNIFYGATLGISPTPSGIRIVDPQLAAVGADGLRRLNSGSPVVNSSVGTYSYVQDDMDGQLRDSLKDVGADEYAGSTIVRRPLTAADVGPNSGTASVPDDDLGGIIRGFKLEDNYPNPFNPTTMIRFTIQNSQFTILKVFDLLGREVATLVNEALSPGRYEIVFDARLSGREELSSGIYFYTLQSGSFLTTKKMMMIR